MPSNGGDQPAAVLAAEQRHLERSREFLGLMRDDVLGLRAMGGDPLSEEFLKADLHRRAEALKDIPDVPLFFGRLDYAAGEQFHIGRRHVHDPDGQPVVIDWRAPISRPFYQASQAEPMNLDRRRRFGFSGGELTAFEDEDFSGITADGPAPATPAGAAPTSRILIEEIERPRSGPMRDIVATIQPDQDEIVRADAGESICVQGAPGTGKTAVGLHRVAFLLYAHASRMMRGGVLVIGPNRAFLSYIRNVLPALGEAGVAQQTMAELIGGFPVRAADSDLAARVKGDARMAEVVHRAVWAGLREPAEGIMLSRGSRRWRVSRGELASLVEALRERGVRYGAGRDMLGHQIAHLILTQMEAAGEPCDDRTHDAVRRTRLVRAAVDGIWPAVDPARLVLRLLSDPHVLADAAEGILGEEEQQAIRWDRPPRGVAAAHWSAADAVLVDEARGVIERMPSLAHVVVDEAQDLSPMECRAVGRRCSTGSATVLGDIAQATSPAATADWPRILAHLGKPQAPLRVLDVGYRVPRQILDFASLLLPDIAPGVAAARSLRQDPGSAEILAVTPATMTAGLVNACAAALAKPGSVAVIAADQQVAGLAQALSRGGIEHQTLDGSAGDGADARLSVVAVSLVKGLEFDHVIVVEPAQIAGASSRGLHHLYVALTRAVSRLTVVHAQPLPGALRGASFGG